MAAGITQKEVYTSLNMPQDMDVVKALAKQLANLMEMLTVTNANMLELRREIHELRSTRPTTSNSSVNNLRREEELKLSDLPFFDGDEDAEHT